MIFIDIDGVLVDFYGGAKKFGLELEINVFGKWKWKDCQKCGRDAANVCWCPWPSPEEFYAEADLQPWALKLVDALDENTSDGNGRYKFITKDHAGHKRDFLRYKALFAPGTYDVIEASDKSEYCGRPIDLLIDDNYAECHAWSEKGGFAYHFNLASKSPFEDFAKWWRMEK